MQRPPSGRGGPRRPKPDHEVRGPIDDLGLVGETAVEFKARQFHNPFETVQIASATRICASTSAQLRGGGPESTSIPSPKRPVINPSGPLEIWPET